MGMIRPPARRKSDLAIQVVAILLLTGMPQRAPAAASAYKWPVVIPVQRTYLFAGLSEGREPKLDMLIKGEAGRPLYRLLCLSGDDSGRSDVQHGGEENEFSGVFDCHLHPLYGASRIEGSLLDYDALDRSDVFSQARFFGQDAVGECASYPEYGARRQFRLRGMQVDFRFSDITFSEIRTATDTPRVKSFRFMVRVRPDPSAITAIAEPPSVVNPPLLQNGLFDCSSVVRRHVPGRVTSEFLGANQLAPPYAEIRPVQRKEILRENQFELSIEDDAGRKAYQFSCLDRNPWGIVCGLFLPDSKINLLAESVDPYSHLERSTFLDNQLQGSCAAYPEWGSHRVFRLRHLRVSVEFTPSVPTQPPRPEDTPQELSEALHISVQISQDPSAESPIAPPPRFAYWGYLPLRNPCATPVLAPHRSGLVEHK